jgi:hypothetical protein
MAERSPAGVRTAPGRGADRAGRCRPRTAAGRRGADGNAGIRCGRRHEETRRANVKPMRRGAVSIGLPSLQRVQPRLRKTPRRVHVGMWSIYTGRVGFPPAPRSDPLAARDKSAPQLPDRLALIHENAPGRVFDAGCFRSNRRRPGASRRCVSVERTSPRRGLNDISVLSKNCYGRSFSPIRLSGRPQSRPPVR